MFKESIVLRDLISNDRTAFYKWINDDEVVKYSLSLFQKIKTEKEIDTWFDSVLDDKKSVNKAVIFDNKIIGYAGISSISKINNSGEYFIMIGEKELHGKGIGTFVTKEIINIAFNDLNLNRLSLTVSSINDYAIKVYSKAGFVEEGVMRQACLRGSTYHDKIIMSIIREDRES